MAPTSKTLASGIQHKESDPFWSAVRANLAFRDDATVHQEWERSQLLRLGSRTTPMRIVLEQAESLVRTRANVVIQGSPGSPRMEMAQIIHAAATARGASPCMCNCAGAKSSTASGILAKARKAETTLILSHVDKADKSLQHTLLRFLEAAENQAQMHCISITTNDLAELTAAGAFDSDLLAYLNYDRRIIIPPLKDHPWDIMPNVVSRLLGEPTADKIRYISYAALVFLREFDWPGDLRQLNGLIDGVCAEAIHSGDTALRLEQMIEWFRHVVPAYHLAQEDRDDSAELNQWTAQLGSAEMAQLFAKHFKTPDKDATPEMGGWDKFAKKEGYCPILFAADVGVGTLICNFRLQPLYASRRWLASEKNPHRSGWQKLLAEAEKDRASEITVESADTEILFDVQKMAQDLQPFLRIEPSHQESSVKGTPGIPVGGGAALHSRRHPPRDWRIHDEVSHCYGLAGFGSLEQVCEAVAKKWENISGRRVKNLYYELSYEKRPPNCVLPSQEYLDKRYPQYIRTKIE